MAGLKANKGDWSEIYALFYLLAHGKIHAANSKLEPLENAFYPVLKIFREENVNEKVEFQLPALLNSYGKTVANNNATVSVFLNNELLYNVSQTEIVNQLSILLKGIKNGAERAFSLEYTEEFMNKLHCYKVKAPSKDKADILIQLHDIHTGYTPICGFSIKSKLGSASTLLNADKSTNFIYQVCNLSNEQALLANNVDEKSRSKLIDRVKNIYDAGGYLDFVGMSSNIFYNNLMLIDSNMPKILANILLESFKTKAKTCNDLLNKVESDDSLKYKIPGIYKYKFKKLLCASALGMTPGKSWSGYDEANGGYIIVKKDGDVVAYYLYDRNSFEDYLLNDTRFDRPSSSRHGYGSVYLATESNAIESVNIPYIKLNIQIRFLS